MINAYGKSKKKPQKTPKNPIKKPQKFMKNKNNKFMKK